MFIKTNTVRKLTMSMKAQAIKKENKKQPNLNKANLIKIALITRGLKQKDIADEFGISSAAVRRAICGLSPNRRVDEWCRDNLGVAI